jgi:alpha-1,3-rhamnosyl/mannosyltransferase
LQPKLHVISPGVDERYLDATPDWRPIVLGDQVVKEPYLLYLGGADPRKRLMWALQAWWSGAGSRASMVVCGVEAGAHAQIRSSVPREMQSRLFLAPFIGSIPRCTRGSGCRWSRRRRWARACCSVMWAALAS